MAFDPTEHYLTPEHIHLSLKKQVIDYYVRDYPYDNRCANNTYGFDYNVTDIKKEIRKNAIKLMAIYFPQFHEVEENNTLYLTERLETYL